MHEPLMPPEERSTQALGHAQPSARLQHLAAEHERLRKKVLRRRRELERFEGDLREIGVAVSSRTTSLVEEALRLDAAIHASFADILASKKLSKRARADVRDIYETLIQAGTISPPRAARAHAADAGPGAHAGRHTGPGRAEAHPGAEPGDGGQAADASHRGRAAHLRDLRKTFLALADAVHPDKVQSEEEKQARTEAMKELNQAYRDGDLARLLELERAWNLEGKLDAGGDDELERRCQSLERKNALLAEQLGQLGETLRSLRQSPPGAVVVDVRRLRRERDPDPVATVLEPLDGEIAILRQVASFVQAFQNGEMSLARFLDGPLLPCQLDDDDEDLDDDDDLDFDELLDLIQQAVTEAARSPSKQRRGRTR